MSYDEAVEFFSEGRLIIERKQQRWRLIVGRAIRLISITRWQAGDHEACAEDMKKKQGAAFSRRSFSDDFPARGISNRSSCARGHAGRSIADL